MWLLPCAPLCSHVLLALVSVLVFVSVLWVPQGHEVVLFQPAKKFAPLMEKASHQSPLTTHHSQQARVALATRGAVLTSFSTSFHNRRHCLCLAHPWDPPQREHLDYLPDSSDLLHW